MKISINLDEELAGVLKDRAQGLRLPVATYVVTLLAQTLLSPAGSQINGKSNPSPNAAPSREKRGPGRPALEKTAAQRRKEEALLSWKKSGPKGGLCPGSRQIGERDSGASGFKWDYGICPVCHVGFLKGIAQPGGGVMVQDHGDGVVPESNESLDPVPYGSTVPEEEAPEDEGLEPWESRT